MTTTSAFAETAALMGDPARAAMLTALMDGRALTAAELARHAGITPQTASSHLARLTGAGLLAMERQGRHRYHRVASPAIARMLESVMTVSAEIRAVSAGRRIRVGPREAQLRRARTCYDHLAGEVAVAVADGMLARGEIEFGADGGVLTEMGARALRAFGATLPDPARGTGRVFCRPCLDWSERRPHIAGAVGAAICTRCFDLGWVRRIAQTRAVEVTPVGRAGFAATFGVRLVSLAA